MPPLPTMVTCPGLELARAAVGQPPPHPLADWGAEIPSLGDRPINSFIKAYIFWGISSSWLPRHGVWG